jgi:protein TonB
VNGTVQPVPAQPTIEPAITAAASDTEPGADTHAASPPAPDVQAVLRALRQRIEVEKIYPMLAWRRGWEGLVQLGFRVGHGGTIHDVHVTRSSGYAVLDQSALRALQRVQSVPRDAWIEGYSAELELSVVYQLREG